MAFLSEPEPERGAVLPVAPGIRRIVAANPGPMTYHGTNTYLIETKQGLVVLDPGPDLPAHVEAVLRATGGKVDLILLSHTHHDHLEATPALAAATGARTGGYRTSAVASFTPDIPLDDGAEIAGMTALHTPGHASDHICYAFMGPDGAKVLFSADHVMSWNSSVVSPPDGDMGDYFVSLKKVLDRDDSVFLPGHGPALPEPQRLTRALLFHRIERERAILARLHRAPADTGALRDALYSQTHPRLQKAAERNVLAHLMKLETEGKVTREQEVWRAA
ncbi:MAG: MBL fold metallo-hydrolase [Rhodospirillales bacterium]|nr:MBL fold metallo-hydrolase [Rhodospirillales bacterium]